MRVQSEHHSNSHVQTGTQACGQQCEVYRSPSRGTIGSSPETGAMAACHFLSGRPPARCTSACISLQATDRAPGKYSFSSTVTGSCTAMPVAGALSWIAVLAPTRGGMQEGRAGVDVTSVLVAHSTGQHLKGQAAIVQCCECYDCRLLLDSVPAQLQGILPRHLRNLRLGLASVLWR